MRRQLQRELGDGVLGVGELGIDRGLLWGLVLLGAGWGLLWGLVLLVRV